MYIFYWTLTHILFYILPLILILVWRAYWFLKGSVNLSLVAGCTYIYAWIMQPFRHALLSMYYWWCSCIWYPKVSILISVAIFCLRRLRSGWQFNRIFWPPKSSPNSSPTWSHSFLGRHPSLGGLLGGLKILLNCHPELQARCMWYNIWSQYTKT